MKVPTNGGRVRELREAKSWTQERLAERANTSNRTTQRIEKGEGARRDIVGAVAAALDVPVEEILTTADMENAAIDVPGHGWPVRLNRVTSGKKLLDLLLWSSRLMFDHDLDPDSKLAVSLEVFIDKCGEISMDQVHLDQVDTSFAVETVIQEFDRIGSLNSSLETLSSYGVYVYAGAYARKFTIPIPEGAEFSRFDKSVDPETGEEVGLNMIEFVVLIHMLSRDLPSITAHVDHKADDELLDRERSDEELGDPRAWKRISRLRRTTEADDQTDTE